MERDNNNEVGEDQTIGASSSDDYEARQNLWDQQWPMSDQQDRAHPIEEIDNLDEETPFPNTVGTRDPMEAVRDAEPYTAPSDPPVLPGGTEAIHTATEWGEDVLETTAREEPFRGDGTLQDAALLALREDSLMSAYTVIPHAVDGVITLRGVVSDLEDAEHALNLVGEIEGVVDVVDELTVDPNVQPKSL